MAPHRLAALLLVASVFVCQAVVTLGFISPKASVAVGRTAGEAFVGETLQQKGLGRGQSCMVSSRPDNRGGDGATMRLGVSMGAASLLSCWSDARTESNLRKLSHICTTFFIHAQRQPL
ncbi:unnamed protein product [Ectocarpus sp. CCAP 1310/34]|nr:unnamed protein product [Ectocarpus sp. CCAP 1310/34]